MKNKVGKFLIVTLATACIGIPSSKALELSTEQIANELKDMYGQAPDRITVIGEHIFTEALTNEALMLGATSINADITDAKIKDKSILDNMSSWRFSADFEIDESGNVLVKNYTYKNSLTGKVKPADGQKFNIKYIDYQNIENVAKVTFNYGDKTEVKRVEKGQKVEKPADPVKEGYIFKGWKLNGEAFDFENSTITDNIELVAEFKNQTATVEDETSLNLALADNEVTKIVLGKSFTVDSSVIVSRDIVIDGAGNTISFKSVPKYVSGGSNYVFKVYGAAADKKINVTLSNMEVSNSLGAIIAGANSVVTVDNVDVSGNKWGGIEVVDTLVVKSIKMTDEYLAHPVVWVDKGNVATAKVTFEGDLANTVFETTIKEQTQYYLSEENAKVEKHTVTFNDGVNNTFVTYEKGAKIAKPADPTREGFKFIEWRLKGEETAFDFENSKVESDMEIEAVWKATTLEVTDEVSLNAALADTDVTRIILGKTFTVNSAIKVSRSVEIDGNNNTISAVDAPEYAENENNNYLFNVAGDPNAESKMNVSFKNIKISNSKGAILAGTNAVVTVDSVDVTDNVLGGIEVVDTLVVNSLKMEDENYDHPSVWVKAENIKTANITFANSTKVNIEGNDQYYLVEDNSKAYQVKDADDLINSLKNENVKRVVLKNNLTLDDTLTVNRDVTLDLNGHSVDKLIKVTNGNVVIENGFVSTTGKSIIASGEGNVVTLNNMNVTSKGQAIDAGNGAKVVFNSGNVDSQETALAVYNGGKLEVNGGTFTTKDNNVISTNGTAGYASSSIVVTGGTFNGNITSAGWIACGVYVANNDVVTLNGGTFNITNGVGVLARSGRTIINEGVEFNVTKELEAGWIGDKKMNIPSGHEIVKDLKANYPGGTPTVEDNNTKYEVYTFE